MPQPKLFRIIDKAVYDYRLIEEGDRILVGISGGKDSAALAHYFACRQKQGRERFSFAGLHVAADIGSPVSAELRRQFAQWGVPLAEMSVSVFGRLKPGHSMNCWWCSTQRRTELNSYAIAHGYNKIALGHHLDDMLETLLMNAFGKGELSTMPPRLTYQKYPVTIIRPLCYADIPAIVEHAEAYSYSTATCTCGYQENSGRKDARARLAALTGGSYAHKRRLFEALKNIRPEYLP